MFSSYLTPYNMYSAWCRYSLMSFPSLVVNVFNYHEKLYLNFLDFQDTWPLIPGKLILFYHFYHGLGIPHV